MKILILLISTVLFVEAIIPDDEIEEKWFRFQAKYQKSYKSTIQYYKRRSIFKDNLIQNNAHNERYERGEVSYKKGVNKFSDMTGKEFVDYVSYGLPRPSLLQGGITYNRENIFNGTESIDWRDKGAVTPVKDMGLCGSSYAYSAIGAIEGQLQNVRGYITNLSVQNILDCTWDYGNDGCVGGLMTNCFQYAKEYGIESEEDYPLRGSAGHNCLFNGDKSAGKLHNFGIISSGSEEVLQNALATIGPISIGMHVTEDFQGYQSGIFDDKICTSTHLNHASLAVGYGTENGVDYYIVKNSFGDDWGENGYFRIVRNKENRCGIATMASFPILE